MKDIFALLSGLRKEGKLELSIYECEELPTTIPNLYHDLFYRKHIWFAVFWLTRACQQEPFL
jgi:hypothetical protein